MAKHDENKDVRLVSRIAKVNTVNKTIKAPKGTLIGIRSWGRIDFLTNFCGYTFIWDNSANAGLSSNDSDGSSKRNIKKQKKEHQLTDKTKRNNKRKQND